MKEVHLDKFEALGNDFLVRIDGGGTVLDSTFVTAACDRHRGVGADGVIALCPRGPGTVSFELRNADGSPAETSGNGLRCAALAARRAGYGSSVRFETPAGMLETALCSGDATAALVRTEMGLVTVSEATSPVPGLVATHVDLGNPHLVLYGEGLDELDLVSLGEAENATTPGGVNVELVTVHDADRVALRVYERGAGLTLACGSGSVAAAAALRQAEIVGDRVLVENPGGQLEVELSVLGPGRFRADLTGPVRHVASIVLDLESLARETLSAVRS